MLVDVTPRVEAAFRRHAEEALPEEACGLLGRTRESAVRFVRYIPMGNLAHSDARFEMDPVEIARAEHALRQSGLQLGGVFHSHPDRPALPSEADRQAAWSGLIQLILSGESGELTAWTLRGDRFAKLSQVFGSAAG